MRCLARIGQRYGPGGWAAGFHLHGGRAARDHCAAESVRAFSSAGVGETDFG
jgi:hypothetical protein